MNDMMIKLLLLIELSMERNVINLKAVLREMFRKNVLIIHGGSFRVRETYPAVKL